MGWSSGTEYVDGVWDVVSKYIPDSDKAAVASRIIDIFEQGDWDCVLESTMVHEVADLDPEFKFKWFYKSDLDWAFNTYTLRTFDEARTFLIEQNGVDDKEVSKMKPYIKKWLKQKSME